MGRSLADIRVILEALEGYNFDYQAVVDEFDVPENFVKNWWVKHAEEWLGRDIALAHQPFKKTSAAKPKYKETDMVADAIETLQKPEIIGHDRTKDSLADLISKQELGRLKDLDIASAEAKALIVHKAANVKLAAIQRLHDEIDEFTTDELLRVIEVLNKVDDEEIQDIRKKASSFTQLIQNQTVYNK